MVTIRFIRHADMYNGGETATFPSSEAERYVKRGVAEYVGVDSPTDQSEQQPEDEETLKNWGSEIPPLDEVNDAVTETAETTETAVKTTDQSEQPEQSTKPKTTTKKEGKK